MSIMLLLFLFAANIAEPPEPLPLEVDPAFEEAYQEFWDTAWQMEKDGVGSAQGQQFMAESAEELMLSFGRSEYVQQILLIQYELQASGAPAREQMQAQMQAQSMPGLAGDLLDEGDFLRAAIRFWPSPSPEFQQFLYKTLERGSYSEDADAFRVGFKVFVDVLVEDCPASDADGRSSHPVCGPIVDFMFERHAIMAWLTVMEIEGVDEDSVADHYDLLLSFARPYNRVASRTDPTSVDPQVIEDCRALLREFVHDDSLWARVFAAEILNKVPYMRDPEIEAALLADPHWLIQRRLVYLHEPPAEE